MHEQSLWSGIGQKVVFLLVVWSLLDFRFQVFRVSSTQLNSIADGDYKSSIEAVRETPLILSAKEMTLQPCHITSHVVRNCVAFLQLITVIF